MLVATSCSSAAKSIESPSVAGTIDVVSAAPGSTVESAAQCVHTDPGMMPISVYRALYCPDGTVVWVRGVVRQNADGSTMLCDDGSGDICLKVVGANVLTGPGAGGGTAFYSGVIVKGVLTAGR